MAKNDVEEWRVISAFPNYDVSSFGNVKRNCPDKRGRNDQLLMKIKTQSRTGNREVSLVEDNGRRTVTVARLVCDAFYGPSSDQNARHIDGDISNNRLDNLEWGGEVCGESNSRSKLNEEIVKGIRTSMETDLEVATRLGVALVTVQYVRRGFTWRHVS